MRKTEKNRQNGLFSKVSALIAGVVIGGVLIALLLMGPLARSPFQAEESASEVSITQLEDTVSAASELTVTKIGYAGFESVNDSKIVGTPLGSFIVPFTKNSQLIAYKGTIGLGFDTDDIEYSVDNEAKVITVKLPEIVILYDEFDEEGTHAYVLSENVFNPATFEKDLTFITKVKASEEASVMDDAETLRQAQEYAEMAIGNIIGSLDATKAFSIEFE